jgi:lipoyl(octanoyl) transferase
MMDRLANESKRSPSGFCCAYHLGTVNYKDAYCLQKRLQQERIDGLIGDTILILDHPPVITLGRRGNQSNVLVPEAYFREQGIEVFHADRGGDVTFHNPGQIVTYFIVNIDSMGISIYQYVRSLEEIVIQALVDFHIKGERDKKHPGVWVGNKKICAIGLHVSRGVSTHGFALNVNNDLAITSYIHPCGLHDKSVTSLFDLLSRTVDINTVVAALLQKMGRILGVKVDFREAASKNENHMKVISRCP